jgi:hypothetical protein
MDSSPTIVGNLFSNSRLLNRLSISAGEQIAFYGSIPTPSSITKKKFEIFDIQEKKKNSSLYLISYWEVSNRARQRDDSHPASASKNIERFTPIASSRPIEIFTRRRLIEKSIIS